MEKKTVKSAGAKTQKEAPKNYFSQLDYSKLELGLEEMLKSGLHFGHQKARKNPKMDEYIFTVRKGISILDLEKTKAKLEEALEFLSKLKAEGKQILFVGTKPQAKEAMRQLAEFLEMPFVTERWLGGTFTNFSVLGKRVKYLVDSTEKLERGEFKKYTKFEQVKKAEELEKMEKRMGGIKSMVGLPAAIFVIGIKEDNLAITEAQKMGIPVVAMVDTNNDPGAIDYPIPCNDDAVSAIRFVLGQVAKTLKK